MCIRDRLVIIVCIYPFFGKMMPGPFHTSALPFSRTISNLSIGLTTGLYDSTLTISANYTFLFCVFGGVMSATGVQKFFGEFGKWTVGPVSYTHLDVYKRQILDAFLNAYLFFQLFQSRN